jgi:uncharacterized membrane protein
MSNHPDKMHAMKFSSKWNIRGMSKVRNTVGAIVKYKAWNISNTINMLALILMILLGAWFRYYYIDGKSLWFDEGITAEIISLDRYNFITILWHHEANMALYFVLLRAWTQMGDSVAMLRGFSALSSLATIPVIYMLGRKLFSNGVGLAAALLLAFNAYSVRYAQEARSYSLVTLLVMLSTYFFVCAVQSGRKRDWSFYVAASALAIYSHLFAVLVVVAHGIALASSFGLAGKAEEQSSSRDHVAQGFQYAVLCIVLCALPMWVFIFIKGPGEIQWIKPTTPRILLDLFLNFSGNAGGAFIQQVSEHSLASIMTLFLCPLYLVLAALGVTRSLFPRMETSNERFCHLLPLYWFLVPVVISLAFSLLQPVFFVRYLIICLPALVLMAAVGAMSFQRLWLRGIAVFVTCLLAVGGVWAYYANDFDIGREDFRGASKYVLTNTQAGDAVLFYHSYGRFSFSYYADHMHTAIRPSIIFPGSDARTWLNFTTPITSTLLNDLAQNHRRVWLVLTKNMDGQEEDETTTLFKDSVDSTRHLVAIRQFDLIRVYLYER